MADPEIKKPRERSKEYPLFTQKFCIEFTDTINSKLGNRFSSADQLAKTFGKSVSTLGSQLSSCKQYDLLELKKGEGYKPTEWYYKVTRGRTDEDKREATIHCIRSPYIYNDLFEKYEGQELPSDLPSIFYWDYKITESAKDGAAKIFLENIQDLNLLTEDGKLIISHRDAKQVDPVIPPVDHAAGMGGFRETPHADTFKPTHKLPSIGLKRSDVKVSTGRFVTVEFPEDLTSAEIDRLIANLELWKD